MLDMDKITKEHEELFPLATAESQFLKLEEEIGEWENAKDDAHVKNELADIFIVCCGLNRWFPKTANNLAMWFIGGIEDDVEDVVNKKWNVDQLREWVWDGRTYKHKGKDGHE